MKKPNYYIGIDPGTHTGYAVWSTHTKALNFVGSMRTCEAEDMILKIFVGQAPTFHVIVEDTRSLRLPRALQKAGDSYLRGVGSVHRDMSRWEEWLTFHKIPFTMAGLSPKVFRTGNAEWFRKFTGYQGKTNEHGRAAAGLVFGR